MPRNAAAAPTEPSRPLIVRLRNWVGDVVLGVPLLRLLAAQGYTLHLVGKGWAVAMLKGEGWSIEVLAPDWRARVVQLRRLRTRCRAADPGFDKRLNALALPFSFSSALDMRLAGLRALGYAHEGRSPLLAHAMQRQKGSHELASYWHLAGPLLSAPLPPPPAAIALQVAPEHQLAAQALRQAHEIGDGYIVLCPFAGGTFKKLPKTWPEFPAFAQALRSLGRPLVLCPGPGEAAVAQRDFAGCTVLEGVNLGVYAALLRDAALMVSNDTGPGHLAAAVATPTLSVLGPTDAAQWGPWGPTVTLAQAPGRVWPSVADVLAQAQDLLMAHGAMRLG